MTKSKILALLCSIIFSFNLFADDDYNEYHEYKNKSYKYEKIHPYYGFDYLELNKNQKLKLREILISHKKSYKRFYKFKYEKLEELEDLFKNDIFNKKEYRRIISEIDSYAIDIQINKLKAIHQILNKNQRKLFSYNIKEWKIE